MPSMSATTRSAGSGSQPPHCSCARHSNGMMAEASLPLRIFVDRRLCPGEILRRERECVRLFRTKAADGHAWLPWRRTSAGSTGHGRSGSMTAHLSRPAPTHYSLRLLVPLRLSQRQSKLRQCSNVCELMVVCIEKHDQFATRISCAKFRLTASANRSRERSRSRMK